MKMSPSFKVGILTLVALIILLFTVLWIKGRSFSSAERIEVHFKDVNGMRPGSGVQMMGLRVGQVEEIIPVVDGESSYVKMKFVITEPGITIPGINAVYTAVRADWRTVFGNHTAKSSFSVYSCYWKRAFIK